MMNQQTMDQAIDQVKAIYQQVTGQAAPEPTPDSPYARIPPEVDAEEYVTMKAASLFERVKTIAPAQSQVRAHNGAAQMMPAMPIPNALLRSENELRWVLEMPGVSKSSIEVELLATTLKVSASRPAVSVNKGDQVISSDFAMGRVERTLNLPFGVEPGHIQASLTDGLLTIRVRLPAGGTRAQRIEVR
jgi:HSP20 family molecular chaperone IbpA